MERPTQLHRDGSSNRRRSVSEGIKVNRSDRGQCAHGFRDDRDCTSCVTRHCPGGPSCDCEEGHTNATFSVSPSVPIW